jgi:transketolase
MAVAPDHGTLDELSVNTIRTLSMDAVQQANSGHPGTPMALAPLAYVLFTRVMEHSPSDPTWPDRDRFVLSAGHASMLLYSTLYLAGYELSLDDLKNFRQLHSPTAGHPEYNHAPGIETTTGPLGQGIATAVGMALAERMQAERFNVDGHEIVDHYTYVIASDGDMQEGVQAEAASLAGHLGLGRLIAFYDDNHITIEGDTPLAFTESVADRYEAYGWHVQQPRRGHRDRVARARAGRRQGGRGPPEPDRRPHAHRARLAEQGGTHGAHGSPLGEDEIRLTKQVYSFPSEEPFFVPGRGARALPPLRGSRQGAAAPLDGALRAYREANPELAAEFERSWKGEPPEGWDADRPRKTPDEKGVATRKASETALNWVAKSVPALVGGSADLAPSTLTLIEGAESVQRDNYGGRNLHFGIREHGMGAIVNGLVLHGFRAYGATFLIFSDYMRGASASAR